MIASFVFLPYSDTTHEVCEEKISKSISSKGFGNLCKNEFMRKFFYQNGSKGKHIFDFA